MSPSISKLPGVGHTGTACTGAALAPTTSSAIANAAIMEMIRATGFWCRNERRDRLRSRRVDPLLAECLLICGAPIGDGDRTRPRPERDNRARVELPPGRHDVGRAANSPAPRGMRYCH